MPGSAVVLLHGNSGALFLDFVVAIHEDQLGLEAADLLFVHLGKGGNDEQVTAGRPPRRRAVDGNDAAATRCANGVGDEALAVVDVPDMDLLVFCEIGRIVLTQ